MLYDTKLFNEHGVLCNKFLQETNYLLENFGTPSRIGFGYAAHSLQLL